MELNSAPEESGEPAPATLPGDELTRALIAVDNGAPLGPIAERMGLTPDALRKRLDRLRTKLGRAAVGKASTNGPGPTPLEILGQVEVATRLDKLAASLTELAANLDAQGQASTARLQALDERTGAATKAVESLTHSVAELGQRSGSLDAIAQSVTHTDAAVSRNASDLERLRSYIEAIGPQLKAETIGLRAAVEKATGADELGKPALERIEAQAREIASLRAELKELARYVKAIWADTHATRTGLAARGIVKPPPEPVR